MEQGNDMAGGWQPKLCDTFEPMRTPKIFNLSPNAPAFFPKDYQATGIPQQQTGPYNPQDHYQAPMDNQQPHASLVQQRMTTVQMGGSHPVGANGGGGGMANGSSPQFKVSDIQNRMHNLRINPASGGVGGAGTGVGGGVPRADNNGKEFNHHQHHQQPMQQHHLPPHRGHQQQQPYHGGHHGHNHRQPNVQQMHQPYPYGVGYSNAINNQMNHPILGSGNHHLVTSNLPSGGGSGMNENRKYNGGGGGGGSGQQHHHSRQRHQHQHHHHQHHQGGGSGGGGGGGGGGAAHRMMAGGSMTPMAPGGGNAKTIPAGADNNDDAQTIALDYLTEVIAELYDNPGMFEDVKKKLPDMLGEFRDDHYVMSNAVEMIFEQSIKETNFRYMGARLCQLLDCLDRNPESLIRVLLLLKMGDQQSQLSYCIIHEQVTVRGTTLFLGELYKQLRSQANELSKHIAKHVVLAINILLRKEGPENVKCVCQCLKLCGYELEEDRRDDVAEILQALGTLQPMTQSSVGNLISSVLELHDNSWGRREEDNADLMGTTVHVLNPEEPVLYGPDGEVMTEEENSFLHTTTNAARNGNNRDFYDDDDDDDEEDFVQSRTGAEKVAMDYYGHDEPEDEEAEYDHALRVFLKQQQQQQRHAFDGTGEGNNVGEFVEPARQVYLKQQQQQQQQQQHQQHQHPHQQQQHMAPYVRGPSNRGDEEAGGMCPL